MLRWRNFLLSLLWVLAGAFAAHGDELTGVTITTPGGDVVVMVEIADSHAERARGLMEREDLPPGQGMLFVFEREGERSFWMKNTPLSLDILFFDGEGSWVNSHLGTRPYSLTSLKSARPAQYALELKAGEAERLGLGAGARLRPPDEAH